MKPVYYLAVDIGASSGRHILASMDNGRMVLEEVYRFENGMVNTGGKKLWDVDKLYENILEGMKECKRLGKIPVSMSIDTWAVDYVLLDDNDKRIGDVYGYRDERTDGMDKEVYRLIEEGILYTRTGIQKQKFNTIYQLMADKLKRPEQLEKAKTFIMLPDYFQFMLTGVKASEYTNATSTQLVNPETKQWDYELINMLGINRDMFMELKQPGTVIGKLTESVKQKIGFNTNVVMCASHDTASAVMAVPTVSDNVLYLSSGTWSLMGTELLKARCDEKSRKCNFTNEGGYDYRFRYLKNIMGLWIIQSVRHELNDKYTFAELCEEAEKADYITSVIDVNDEYFLAPENMTEAIKSYCRNNNMSVPDTVGEVAAVVYKSLAGSYADTVSQIEENTDTVYEAIYVIGGGANAAYLNRLTAISTGKKVIAGPVEATAIGNAMAQMITDGIFKNLKEARACVMQSFDIRQFEKCE
jgi:rhamnulokinase